MATSKNTRGISKTNREKTNISNSHINKMKGYHPEPGDNTKFLELSMELFNMPDIDLHNAEEVAQRLNDYFSIYAKYDLKPTIAGMALALNGMSRRTLWGIANDAPTGGAGYTTALPKEVALLIKKSYKMMENLWENYMVSGKLNPLTGIFLGNNNYGYQNKQEHVITAKNNDDSMSEQELLEAANLLPDDYYEKKQK